MKVLSIVDDVQKELEKIEEEDKDTDGYETDRDPFSLAQQQVDLQQMQFQQEAKQDEGVE